MWFARILFALCVLPAISHAADCSLKPPRPALVQIDYKGGCQGGLAHGRGVALYQVTDQTKDDVIRHEGEFVNGVANGQTTYSSRSGQFGFQGEFRNWRPYEGVAFQPSAFGQFLEVTYRNGDIASKEYKSRNGSAPPPQVAHQPTGPNPLAMLLERALNKKLNQAQQQPADSIRQQAADADAAIRQQSQAANAHIANQAREADAQSRASIAAADAQSRANIAMWDAQAKANLAQQSANARALIQSQSRAADVHIANQAREAEAQSRASIAAADAQSKANIAIWDAQAKARREAESAESKALIERQTALAAAAMREQSRASDARMAAQSREIEDQRKRQEAVKVAPPQVVYSTNGTAAANSAQSDHVSAQQSTPRIQPQSTVVPSAAPVSGRATHPAAASAPEIGTRTPALVRQASSDADGVATSTATSANQSKLSVGSARHPLTTANSTPALTPNQLNRDPKAEGQQLDNVQNALSAAGVTPIGAPADLANAAISGLRGNYKDAALNVASAVPGPGDVLGVSRLARRTIQFEKEAAEAAVPKIDVIGSATGRSTKVGKTDPQAPSTTSASPQGGAAKDVKKPVNDGFDAHHCPAKDCYKAAPISSEDGPAIKIAADEHPLTASYGTSNAARAYRARQKELLAQGKLMEAIEMDVTDIRSKFGHKYEDGITQLLDYARTLNPQDFVNAKK